MADLKRRFQKRCRMIHDLEAAQGLLDWDHQVMMPPKGGEQRSHQLAALAVVIHEKIKDPELGALIESLDEKGDLDAKMRADLREMKRVRERALKIPESLVAERARVCAKAQMAWERARQNNAFSDFLPHLEQIVELSREIAAALGAEEPYDALLDDYETGITRATIAPLFADLQKRLTTLLDRIRGSSIAPPETAFLSRPCKVEHQEAFIRQVIAEMGFDFEAGRVDRSTHPFTAGTMKDVRITTRYEEHQLQVSLFGLIHEAGHALYEQGLDPERFRDPAGGYCSVGIHESQSRLWENLIGRSHPFWSHYLPRLQKAAPGVLDDVNLEQLYRAINVVSPSLIRVEADEVTYNLHIILRFQLEIALVSGDLKPADLPSAWNEGMKTLLGLTPPDDRQGVLQDIHWAAGLLGYFPTYTLGNLFSAQFMELIREQIPDLEQQISKGNLSVVTRWLNEKIHRPGRLLLAPQLCQQITGKPLGIDAASNYLEQKYTELYKL